MYGIVIVEDEELEREALRAILTENVDGIRILGEARTGPEAVQLIDSCDIDLMLVDINIPKLNGLEVVRHLRQRHTDTKVIITTAYDYFDMTRAAIHLKADEYLLKPIRTPVLVDTVRACLQGFGTRRQCRALAQRLGELVGQNAYRDGVALVRRHVEWIEVQRVHPPRDLILDFTATLIGLVREKGVGIPDALGRQIKDLQSVPLDAAGHRLVLAASLALTDLLFDSDGDRFGQSSKTVQKALDYIERNLNKGVTLEDVADHANVSTCYLSRLFKKSMNTNFITYLTARRIELAKEWLMDTDLPVTSIASRLSYSDVNYFCKSFKKEVGLSPSCFRQQLRLERCQNGSPYAAAER